MTKVIIFTEILKVLSAIKTLHKHSLYPLGLLAICIISRIITHISYVEDIDSMRFALGIQDYDVANFQPHFPAYPVYCSITKVFYTISGNLGISFALTGAIATFLLAYYVPKPIKSVPEVFTALFIIVNPFIWILGNRFMPDLLGAGITFAALYYFISSLQTRSSHSVLSFGVLCGLLAGIRLSYVPMLMLPGLYLMLTNKKTILPLLLGSLGATLIWLIPLIIDTGWTPLIESAQAQTKGHFHEFGGTIISEPNTLSRLQSIFIYSWSDGMGGWLPHRHWLTLLLSTLLLPGLVLGTLQLLKTKRKEILILVCTALVYFIWVMLFQNVLHKSRHILPFIPLLIALIIYGTWKLPTSTTIKTVYSTLMIICTLSVSIPLILQHQRPTALAKTSDYFNTMKYPKIYGPELMQYYLDRSGNEMRYIVDTSNVIPASEVYSFSKLPENRYKLINDTTFYHNPFVNRMWSEITIYRYHAR